MIRNLLIWLPILILIGCGNQSEIPGGTPNVTVETHVDTISYSIGMDIATSFNHQSVDVNPQVFTRGFMDAYGGDETVFTEEEMRSILAAFRVELRQKQQELAKMKAEKNAKEGDEFLSENRTKEGVVETETGLQYKVLESAQGPSPVVTDRVSVHYTGRLIDGTVFDSSVGRDQPASFRLNGVIKGWTEALQLMRVGEKWEVYVPGHLGYGERGSGAKIGPNQLLIFEIELLGIE